MDADAAVLWVDGELRSGFAGLSYRDHGFVTGDGAFEALRIRRGEPFALTRHLARLARSLTALRLPLPDEGHLRRGVKEVVGAFADATGLAEGRVRLTVTAGESPLSSVRGEGPATVVIAAVPLAPSEATERVVTFPGRRNEHGVLAGVKSTSYAENVLALAYARERGCGEAIFANTAGELCEGSGTNVFVVDEGALVTPPLASGCLAGISRGLVLELTGAREATLTLAALAAAPEAFLTSTMRGVQPIAAVDGVALPRCPGAVTQAAAERFADLVARDLDP